MDPTTLEQLDARLSRIEAHLSTLTDLVEQVAPKLAIANASQTIFLEILIRPTLLQLRPPPFTLDSGAQRRRRYPNVRARQLKSPCSRGLLICFPRERRCRNGRALPHGRKPGG